jgi:hypothetical protein
MLKVNGTRRLLVYDDDDDDDVLRENINTLMKLMNSLSLNYYSHGSFAKF